MKKTCFFQWFNLIEVTMAVAVVGIGIAGVMALFPPAIEANKNADNQNYIGMVTSSFLGFLENEYLSDFSNFQTGSFKSFTSNPEPSETLWTGNKTSLSSNGFPGLYKTTSNNVFAVESADKTVTALIAVWQSGDTAIPGFTASDTNIVRRVYIEASWPAILPYASRQKKLYVYDIFNE